MQLYVARADGLHDQLTFGDERVTGALRSRVREQIVLSRDTGGNERHAISCLDTRSGPRAAADRRRRTRSTRSARSRPTARRSRSRTRGATAPTSTSRCRRRRQRAAGARAAHGHHVGGRLERARDPALAHEHAVRPRPVPGRPGDRRARAPDAARGRGRVRVGTAARRRLGRLRLRRGRPVHAARDPRARRRARRSARPTTPTSTTCGSTPRATHIAHVVNRGGPVRAAGSTARASTGLPRGVYGPPEVAADGRISLTVAALADTTDAWSLPGPVRLTRSATGGVDRASLVEPGAALVRELRRAAHPVPAVRRAGPPDRLLGARRARVAVPRPAEPGRRLPRRARHGRRRPERARLDRLRPRLPPPRRRRAAARLGARPRRARPRRSAPATARRSR